VGDQDVGNPGRPVSSWLQVTGEKEHFLARTSALPAKFFLQNVLHLYQQRLVILCVNSLALCKIINKEDAVLSPKSRRKLFQWMFALGIFGAG